jgi:hypothetical protein
MPQYVRHTRSVRFDDLPPRISDKLAEHAESRQIDLLGASGDVRIWLTHSENPPARSALGKLLRHRVNPTDPDSQHWTALVLQATHILVATDGKFRGTSVLSLPLAQASVAADTGLDDGFTITGFPGDQVGSLYVGLGPEPAAAECLSAVHAAVIAAKN